MEELVDIDRVISELEAWLACYFCGQIAHGMAEDEDENSILSCGLKDHGFSYEPFTPENSFAKTRNTMLQVAQRCKAAEEVIEYERTRHGA